MRAWLYLLAAAIAGAIITTPALFVLFLMGGSFDDALLAGLATLMLASGIAVVSMRDIIRCGLAMIVCFLSLAGIYVTLGRYDVVEIFDAPDDETAYGILLDLARHGQVRTETLRAFTREEAEARARQLSALKTRG